MVNTPASDGPLLTLQRSRVPLILPLAVPWYARTGLSSLEYASTVSRGVAEVHSLVLPLFDESIVSPHFLAYLHLVAGGRRFWVYLSRKSSTVLRQCLGSSDPVFSPPPIGYFGTVSRAFPGQNSVAESSVDEWGRRDVES